LDERAGQGKSPWTPLVLEKSLQRLPASGPCLYKMASLAEPPASCLRAARGLRKSKWWLKAARVLRKSKWWLKAATSCTSKSGLFNESNSLQLPPACQYTTTQRDSYTADRTPTQIVPTVKVTINRADTWQPEQSYTHSAVTRCVRST
jgi:hypothetical protein